MVSAQGRTLRAEALPGFRAAPLWSVAHERLPSAQRTLVSRGAAERALFWGRGALDAKLGVVLWLEAVESLLAAGVALALLFDEGGFLIEDAYRFVPGRAPRELLQTAHGRDERIPTEHLGDSHRIATEMLRRATLSAAE